MTVVISPNLVLVPGQDFDADNPIIGWENLVDPSTVTAAAVADDSPVSDTDHPVANLGNTSTYLRFQQDTPAEDFYIQTLLPGTSDVDYVAFAGHNFGSLQRALQLYGALSLDMNGDPVYSALTNEMTVGNNTPLLFRFTPAPYIALKLVVKSTVGGADDIARAAVMYAGKLLVLERKIQVSFTPLPYGRNSDVNTNRSERGQFLGRVLTSAWVETSATIMYLSPSWYRSDMDDFLEAAQTEPFFFAWAPLSYPKEVGYAWCLENPRPEIHEPTGYIQVTLSMQGIVE